MRMFNADGSELGNVRQREPVRRQVSLRPWDRREGGSCGSRPGAGILTLRVEVEVEGRAGRVNMATVDPEELRDPDHAPGRSAGPGAA